MGRGKNLGLAVFTQGHFGIGGFYIPCVKTANPICEIRHSQIGGFYQDSSLMHFMKISCSVGGTPRIGSELYKLSGA